MEIGRLVGIFEANTRDFDNKLKAAEARVSSLKANIASVKADNIGFKNERIANLNVLLGKATAEYKQLSAAQKEAAQSAKQVGQDMGNALSTISPRLGAIASTAGPLAAVAVSLTAIGASAAALFELVRSTSEATGKFTDLSQQTEFAVETLSALANAAETSGGSIETVSGALFIFETKMGEAKDSASEMGKIFKQLGIDTTNHEKALRQALSALTSMTNAEDRATIGKKLFGRSVKELLAALKEGGDLDDAINRQLKDGTLITTQASKAGDRFSDSLIEMNRQFSSVSRIIAGYFTPTFQDAIDTVTKSINENKPLVISWANSFRDAARGAGALAEAIHALAGVITGLNNLPIPMILRVLGNVTGVGGIFTGLEALGRMNAPAWRPAATTGNPFAPWRPKTGFQTPFGNQPQWSPPKGSGGGGGGGGKSQKDILEGLKKEVIDLNTEFRKLDVELFNSANMTALAAEKEKILKEVVTQLNDQNKLAVSKIKDVDDALDVAIGKLPAKSQAAAQALREQAIAQFKSNEQIRIAGELTKSTESLAKEWRQEIDNTRTGTDSYTIAIQELEKAYRKYGLTLDDATRKELEQAAAIQRVLKLTRERLTITAQTRPRFAIEDVDRDAINATRDRIATVDEQVRRERIAAIYDEMRNVAADITSIFDRALYDGIHGGAKRGLQSLALGFLDMIQQIILGNLRNALAEALGGIATGGAKGGGGLLGGLTRIILGGIGGGIGGSVGGSGSGGEATFFGWGGMRASGGPIQAGMAYQVHRDEIIVPTQNAMVYNKQQQSGQTIINNINLPPIPPGSYQSPRSQRQLAAQVVAALQGAHS